MNTTFRPGAMALALAAAFPAAAPATELEPVIVTAPAMAAPLEVSFDPKAPQQPLPANDGASFLKAIPGMSVIRKGGTDGDPVFRGMAASRLNILLDGEQILGGCGMRMDPPTAYVYPETYDRVTLLKGPQTVRYGPGNSAGTVLFERNHRRLEEAGWRFDGSLMAGSFGRHDEVADFRGGSPDFYFRGNASNSHSDDYEDGDGRKVHSRYSRWSAGAAVGWTPDRDTRLEFSATRSDGEAAYADRTMDGARFARENYGIKFERRNLSPWLAKVEAQAYYNYIDHVMDNYSLRPRTAPMPMVNNPDRETVGGRLAFTLRPADTAQLVLGADAQSNRHTLRVTGNQNAIPYQSLARTEDASFDQKALFGEWTQELGIRDRLVAGLRADWWQARDKRQRLLNNAVANPTANQKRDEILPSGFARWEHDLEGGAGTFYAGLGHSERFPDYWELVSPGKEGPTAADLSAFATTRPEKTTQLDLGSTWKAGPWSGFVSGFYNRIEDFILIQSNVARVAPARTVAIVRNVDAVTWGGEAGASYAFTPALRGDATLAYVRGSNETDSRPLGQIPPLEGRLGLTWDNRVWSVGSLLRLVAGQERHAANQGNIVGQDIGRTPGFAVFSINGGWRPAKGVLIAGGVDNLFDKTYAEHISRAGAMVSGFVQTTRVNEPGRTFWLKASIALD